MDVHLLRKTKHKDEFSHVETYWFCHLKLHPNEIFAFQSETVIAYWKQRTDTDSEGTLQMD